MSDMQGFCWPLSAAPGETIEFRTATTASTYSVTYLRLRNRNSDEVSADVIHQSQELVEESVSGKFTLSGRIQPAHPPSEPCADWDIAFKLTVPTEWRSGLYSAKCTDSDGSTFYIVFVINPPGSQHNALLVLANVNTWNAYNPWGGYSRYETPYPVTSTLTFLRPNPHTVNLTIPDGEDTTVFPMYRAMTYDSRHLTRGELWFQNWMESAGYRFDVFTDLDFHSGIVDLGEYSAVILNTHPEYWSTQMFDTLENYLNGGGIVLYFGANGIYDSVDISDDFTAMTVHGTQPNRTRLIRSTTRDDDSARAETQLLGISSPWTLALGDRQINVVHRVAFSVIQPTHRFFKGTGVIAGSLFGDEGWCIDNGPSIPDLTQGGASGWECDQRNKGELQPAPAGTTVHLLAQGINSGELPAELTYFDHPGGGFVLSAGSMTVQGAIPRDAILQTILTNALDEALGWNDSSGTLFAAIFRESDGALFETHHAMTQEQFQSFFDTLFDKGYRLSHWCGYAVEGEDRYTAIWELRSGPPWQAHYQLSADEFQTKFDELLVQGYRLTHVFGCTAEGEDLYGGIWEMSASTRWESRHGLSAEDFQIVFDQLVEEGLRLTYISAFASGDDAKYCAVWEERDSPAWEAHHILNRSDFQATFDDLLAKGYWLVHLWTYTVEGEMRFAGIWEQRDDIETRTYYDLSFAGYQRLFNQQADQKYRPFLVCGCVEPTS